MAKSKSTGSKKLTDKQAKELTSFGAAIDDATVRSLDRIASSPAVGINRRLSLLALSRDAATLAKIRSEAPEAFKEMLECVASFEAHAKGVYECAQSAHVRLMLADCMVGPDNELLVSTGDAA